MPTLLLPAAPHSWFRRVPVLVAAALFASSVFAQTTIDYGNSENDETEYDTSSGSPYNLAVASGSATQSGALSGTGSIDKTGAGTLTLAGSNSYSGTTTVSAGILILDGGNSGTGGITVAGGSLQISDSLSGSTTLAAATLASDSTVNFDLGNDLTFAGVYSGAGGLTKTGSGTLTLAGANTFTGATNLSDGNLTLANANALQASTVTLSGGSVYYSGVDAVTFGGLAGSASLNLPDTSLTVGGNNADTAYSGTVYGSAAFIKAGSGNLTFSGSFDDSSAHLRLDAGTFTLGSTSALQSATVNLNGGTLSFGALTSATLGNLTGSGNLTLENTAETPAAVALSVGDNGNDATYAGALSGAGSLTKTGSGTLTLSGTNTFTGTTTISDGTLTLTSTGSLAGHLTLGSNGTLNLANATGLQASTVTLNGGSVSYSGVNAITFGGLAGSGSLELPTTSLTVGGNNANTAYSGTLSGSGSLIKAGSGNLTFSGSFDDSSASLQLNAGTVTLGSTSALQSATANLNGGTLSFGALTSATLGNLTGSGNLSLENAAETPAAVALSVGNNGNDATYAGVLSGAGSLTKTGSGTLTLSGANTFTGATTISNGTLDLASTGSLAGHLALGSDGTLNLANASGLQASTVTLNGGSLTYSGVNAVTFGGLAGSASLDLPTTSLTVGGNNTDTTYSGTLSGSGTLIKAGSGNLTFSGSFGDSSASLQLNAGTVTVGSTSALQTATVNLSGGTLSFGALTSATLDNLTGSGDLTLENTAETPAAVALSVGYNSNDATYAGALSGAGSLTKTGSGTLTLSGAHTFTGATTISGGTLALTSTGSLAGHLTLASGTLDLANATGLQSSTVTLSGGSLTYNGVNAVTFGGLAGSASLDLPTTSLTVGGNNADTTYSGTLSGSGTLIKAGSGTFTLTSDNNSPGSTTISAGTLQLGTGGATGSLVGNVANSGTLIFNRSASQTYAGVISGTGSVVSDGGVVAFSAAQTYTGNTAIKSGAYIVLATSGDQGLSTSTAVNIESGGFLDISNRATTIAGLTGAGNVYSYGGSAGHLTVNTASGQNQVFSGVLGSEYPNFALTKAGDGALTLSGTNTYTGGTTVSAGTLNLGAGDSTGTLVGNITNHGTVSFNRSGDETFAGVISGTGRVTQEGAIMRFTAAQTYTGSTTVNAGILVLPTAVDQGLAASTTVAVASGATLDISNRALTVAGLTGAGNVYSYGGSAGHLTVDTADGQNQVFSGALGSSYANFALTKAGTGSLTLSGTNTYTGATTVSAGTLQLGSTNALTATSSVDVGAGATLNLNNHTVTIGDLDGGGNIALGSATLTTGNANDHILSGIVSGSGGLTKTGAGILSLTGSNTYTGATVISAGTLHLGESLPLPSSSITIASGATFRLDADSGFTLGSGQTLDGTGTVANGQLTVGSGATLAPGSSPGTLTFTNGLTLAGGGALEFELNDATGSAGTAYDLLAITGALNITATSGTPFSIDLTSLTLANVAGLTANFDSAADYAFTFATTTGGITGFAADKFTIDTSAFTNPFDGTWSVAQNGNNLTLNYAATAIPEPSTYAMIFGAFALALAAWRKRRPQ